ncbi:activator of Hsp90 ATPase [Trametes meyenii]|nr:activator of Hsp90 ATPase [Trametes meyenii]
MTSIPAPLPPSTANWHWKNKTVTPWAKQWFERELSEVRVTGEGTEAVAVERVVEVDGDVELGQRKSKLITIYDCRVVLNWTGTASDGTAVSGKLTIPEVSHEITLDGTSDYVYEWSLSTDRSPAVDALFQLAKKHLPPALEAKFSAFPAAIVDTHGKDLTVSADPSRQGTPAPAASAAKSTTVQNDAALKKKAEGAGVTKSGGQAVNTTSLTVEAQFMAPADDLFSLLTDEKRIPQWTRAPATSTPAQGAEYSLFGGGVKGKFVSVSPPKEFVQTWSLASPTWPEGHTATLTTTLDQGSDSTKVTWSLSGVPLGSEEEITRNLQGYYVHGLKSIGYVQVYPYVPPPQKKRIPAELERSVQTQKSASGGFSTNAFAAIAFAVLAFGAAFALPYFTGRP